MDKKNVIVDLSFDFAVEVVRYCQELVNDRNHIIANQLLKAGTSIGANIKEAQNAESVSDSIHKIKIAAKEAEETEYWLMLSQKTDSKKRNNTEMLDKLFVIKKILNKIITTSKRRGR
jgi:four helix bundle protein